MTDLVKNESAVSAVSGELELVLIECSMLEDSLQVLKIQAQKLDVDGEQKKETKNMALQESSPKVVETMSMAALRKAEEELMTFLNTSRDKVKINVDDYVIFSNLLNNGGFGKIFTVSFFKHF